jgi:hypothetical protein
LNFGGCNDKNVGSHNGNHRLCAKTQNKHEQKKMKKERVKVPKRIATHVFLNNDDGNGKDLLQQYSDIVVEFMNLPWLHSCEC